MVQRAIPEQVNHFNCLVFLLVFCESWSVSRCRGAEICIGLSLTRCFRDAICGAAKEWWSDTWLDVEQLLVVAGIDWRRIPPFFYATVCRRFLHCTRDCLRKVHDLETGCFALGNKHPFLPWENGFNHSYHKSDLCIVPGWEIRYIAQTCKQIMQNQWRNFVFVVKHVFNFKSKMRKKSSNETKLVAFR